MREKNYFLLFVIVIFNSLLQAQITTKLDLRLYTRLQQHHINKANMPLLVKGDMDVIKSLTQKFGGIYKYGYNNISSIEIPEKKAVFNLSVLDIVSKIDHRIFHQFKMWMFNTMVAGREINNSA